MLEVTVDFVSEIITCVKTKTKILCRAILKKLKKFMILGNFQKDSRSSNPNWVLIDTQV